MCSFCHKVSQLCYAYACPSSSSTEDIPITPPLLLPHDQAKVSHTSLPFVFSLLGMLSQSFSIWQTPTHPQKLQLNILPFRGIFSDSVSPFSEVRHFFHCLHIVDTAGCPLKRILPFFNTEW